MFFDHENIFSKDQAITASAVSDNVIDFARYTNDVQKDVGPGNPINLYITVSSTFAGLTDLSISFETSADEAFSTPETLIQTGAVPVAKLTQGYTFPMTVIPDGCLRYARLNYMVNGTASAGSITAGVVVDRQQTKNVGG